MPTIHISITDSTEALRVVADMINAGHTVSIDIDEVVLSDDTDLYVEPWATEVASPQPTTKKLRKKAHDHVTIDEEYIAYRQARYDQRVQDAIKALHVECPSCGSHVSEYCTTPAGKGYKTYVHIDRLRAAQTAGLT